MGKPPKKSGAPAPSVPPPPNNPFAQLAGLRDALPPGEARSAPSPASAAAAGKKSAGPPGPARAVVRYERKGHGGKEVTRVEGLGLPEKERERWLKALKQSLGCGGVLDGEALQLQGDQRERLPALLTARGVRKVVVS